MNRPKLLYLAIALVLVSCGPGTEYRATDGGDMFVIRTIEGRRAWGLYTQNGDNKPDYEYLPCEHDSIYSGAVGPYNIEYLFIAIKGNKKYAYTTFGHKFLFDKTPVTKIEGRNSLSGKHINSTNGNLYHKAHTDQGIYFFSDFGSEYQCFGPYEDFFNGAKGYAYKKNGKWGAVRQESVDLTPDNDLDGAYEKRYVPIFPPIYDGAIEIDGPIKYWIVKQNNAWIAIGTKSGARIQRPASTINLFFGLPILTPQKFQQRHNYENERSYTYKRVGGDNYGTIWIRNPYHAH